MPNLTDNFGTHLTYSDQSGYRWKDKDCDFVETIICQNG
jgi:hypothetical protein